MSLYSSIVMTIILLASMQWDGEETPFARRECSIPSFVSVT